MLSKVINNFEMHYTATGTGSPVVLVHGSFADLRYWNLQRYALADYFEVFALSMRPYWPNAQTATEQSFSVPQYVEDVASFVEALGVGSVQLCGHSLGGHVALRVANRIPELVHSLALAEPGGPLDAELGQSPSRGSPPYVNAMARGAEQIASGDIDGGLDTILTSAAYPGAWDNTPAFYKECARANALTLIAQAAEKRPPLTERDLRSIRQPVLLIGGALSPPPFPSTLDVLEVLAPRNERIRIALGTHLMNIENPKDFNAALITFLRANDVAARKGTA